MKKIILLFALIIMSAVFASADIRLPDLPTPTVTPKATPTAAPAATPMPKDLTAPLNIRVGRSDAKQSVLRIPSSLIKDLNAQMNAAGSPNASAGTSGFSGTQTIISGVFFSLALIFGGVWFWRAKPLGKNQKLVTGAGLCLLVGVSALTVFANVAPPPRKGIDSNTLSDKVRGNYRGVEDEVKVEIIDADYSGAEIELIVPDKEK